MAFIWVSRGFISYKGDNFMISPQFHIFIWGGVNFIINSDNSMVAGCKTRGGSSRPSQSNCGVRVAVGNVIIYYI